MALLLGQLLKPDTSLFSLNTLHREFSALVGLGFCDINNLIYQPSLSDPATVSAREIQDAMRNYQVNEPQAKAILSSMSTKGFSLIQGYVVVQFLETYESFI